MLSTIAISSCVAGSKEITREEAEDRAGKIFGTFLDNKSGFRDGGIIREISIKQTTYENGTPITSSIYYYLERLDARPTNLLYFDEHVKVIKKTDGEKEESEEYYRLYNKELDTTVLWYERSIDKEKQTKVYTNVESEDYKYVNNSLELYDADFNSVFHPYSRSTFGLEEADNFELDWVNEFSDYTSISSIRYFSSDKYNLNIKAKKEYFHNGFSEAFADGSLNLEYYENNSWIISMEQNAPGFGSKSMDGSSFLVKKLTIRLPLNWKKLIVD